MTLQNKNTRWSAFVLLVGPICLFHWRILFLGWLPDGGDMLNQFIPWREFALSCLSEGHLPLWNPYVFCGVPFWANIQTALLFPWNFLHLALGVPQFFAVCIVIHHIIAALGMYFFFLNRNRDCVSALIAATVYAWSGFFILHSNDGHLIHIQAYAYIPLCLLAQDRLREGFTWLRVTGLAAPLAMMILAGHLQLPLYVFYLLLFRALWPFGRPFYYKSTARTVIQTGAGIGASLLICAAVILPLLQFSSYSSTRAGGAEYEFATHDSMPPAHLPTLLAPFLYGDPTRDAPDQKFWETVTGYHEICGYAGVVSIVLAFFAFVPLPEKGGSQKVDGEEQEKYSTPSESPPILGEKKSVYALVSAFILRLIRTRPRSERTRPQSERTRPRSERTHPRHENARSTRDSLPKIGEGSGGVDVDKPLFAGTSRLGETQRGLSGPGSSASCVVTERRFALCLLVIALVLALGRYTPLYRIPYNLLPGFAYFRVPGRLVLFYGLAVSVLAGLGMLRLRQAGWWRFRQRPSVALLLGAGSLLIVFTGLAYINQDGIWGLLKHIEVERSRQAVGLPPDAYDAVASRIPANLIDGRCEAVLRGLTIASVWFWAGLSVAVLLDRFHNSTRWLWLIVWALLFADLLWFAHRFIPSFPEGEWKKRHYRESEVLEIAARDQRYRSLFTDEVVIGRGVPGHTECKHNRPMLLDVKSVRGYDPIQLDTFASFVNMIQGRHPKTKQGGMLYISHARGVHPHGYDRTSARFVVTTQDVPDEFDLVWADPYSPLRMYENPDPKPIVRLMGDSNGQLDVTVQRAGLAEAQVRAETPTRVFFSQCAYPGWRVTVDGEERDIQLVDDVFMQVLVPEGDHVVRFEFRPTIVYAGLAVSGIALLLLAILSLCGMRRRSP